jgi:S-adenosylmethionine:tRNA ribosyltransferase-isomerase
VKKSDFYYDLPISYIAQHPTEYRDRSRLLTLDGMTGAIKDRHFKDIKTLLHPGDCLVLNDTRVIPARLLGRKVDSETAVEFLLLKRLSTTEWEVICRPGRRLKAGAEVEFIPERLTAVIKKVLPDGNRQVEFNFSGIWEEVLNEAGIMPLPPYIHEKLENPERYQTVYAVHNGSSAAPTAGLHFTEELLMELKDMGVSIAYLTLHVGLGTFRPVKAEDLSDHHMHSEYFELTQKACDLMNKAKREGARVICVGTTSCRVVESVAKEDGLIEPASGYTDIFIYPGYRFKIMDALLTNFHLPESTLIMLVAAFGGYKNVMAAYQHAVAEHYRFFSFGDAMFVTKNESPDLPKDKA